MNLLYTARHINETMIPFLLRAQIDAPETIDDGGLLIPEKGFAESVQSAKAADVLISTYYCPNSKYEGDIHLLVCADRFLAHLLRSMHEDGTIDLLETNFHDCTCNGFAVQVLGYTNRLMARQTKDTELEKSILKKLNLFLRGSATAMKNGGFHTPNHRWVLASALSLCYRELGDDSCLEALRLYLDEGIDCDEEGEYTEQSAAIYDIVCNQSMLILQNELGMSELLEHVMRNLDKIIHYIESDGSILTLNSRRQDHGKHMYPFRHALGCLMVCAQPHDEDDVRYKRVATLLEILLNQFEQQLNTICKTHDMNNLLTHILLQPNLDCKYATIPLKDTYERFYHIAGVVRWRNKNTTLTLLRNNPVFMKVQVGKLELLVRVCSTFYAKGQLVAQSIDQIAGGYRLYYTYRWGYKRPLGSKAGTTNWADIPHHLREDVNMLTWNWTVDVIPHDDRISIHIQGDGCDRLPWKMECIYTAGGFVRLSNDSFIPCSAGEWIIAEKEYVYHLQDDWIGVSGGCCEHNYTYNMRGSEPQRMDCYTIFATGFAPVDKTIEITWNV